MEADMMIEKIEEIKKFAGKLNSILPVTDGVALLRLIRQSLVLIADCNDDADIASIAALAAMIWSKSCVEAEFVVQSIDTEKSRQHIVDESIVSVSKALLYTHDEEFSSGSVARAGWLVLAAMLSIDPDLDVVQAFVLVGQDQMSIEEINRPEWKELFEELRGQK